MAEVDWDEVLDSLRSLADILDQTINEFCEEGYFKGCVTLDEKIKPILRELSRDIEARRRVKELAEEAPELAEEGAEEEAPEEE